MKNLRRLACKFDLNQVSASHRKSTQVPASPGQTESQVDPSSQLAATCDSVWPGLNICMTYHLNLGGEQSKIWIFAF